MSSKAILIAAVSYLYWTAPSVSQIQRLQQPLVDDQTGTFSLQQLISPDAFESPFTPAFETYVYEVLEHFHVPGISIALLTPNITISQGYGFAVLNASNSSENVSATPKTLWFTGSTTKSFTAAFLSLLISDSANTSTPLSWTTPISSIIRDDFVLSDDWATAHITLEDAASHRTGLPRHDKSYGRPEGQTVRDVVRLMRDLPMTAEPRTTWQYCNMMFVTLSHVCETLSGGRWLGDLFRERLWEPWGMKDTFLSLEDARKAVLKDAAETADKESHLLNLANGYWYDAINNEYVREKYFTDASVSGAGLIISTVEDYATYLRAVMLQREPLSKAQHENLRQPRSIYEFAYDHPLKVGENSTNPPTLELYGLGWEIGRYKGITRVYHGGAVAGFGAEMLYIPEIQWGITLMANTLSTSNWAAQTIQMRLVDDMLGIPEPERVNWLKYFDDSIARGIERVEKGRENCYPDAPKRGTELEDKKWVPLPGKLSDYTGLYEHPGYGPLNLTLATPNKRLPFVKAAQMAESVGSLEEEKTLVLHADLTYKTWEEVYDFEHVSGEYFVCYGSSPKLNGVLDPTEAMKATFRLGDDGRPFELGIAIEDEMKNEMIWWKRIG
ncbi:hypothetical protein MMC25_004885 [Agyrium rufum]|nr:hypothetical protein [Agyrium rufum]